MTEKYVLIEYLSNLNDVINQPLQFTHRVKFTCFDVSHNYIIFGATSGGLYIFGHSPSKFIKLIPNKEQLVMVSIAPDEKTVAVVTNKGIIVVIKDCIPDNNFEYQVYTQHENNLVTALKWNSTELFCGDQTGKISVISLPNLLTKAIFQTPCASLMNLDSSIVQIDCHLKFLLISTKIRSYLCDTEKEQFRQVGKKLREGDFGGCFFPNSEESESKIYCARPGARLWEVDFNSTVVCTHQFKNTLVKQPSNLIHLDDNVESHLNISDFSNADCLVPESFNFKKLFVIESKFLLTYTDRAFYIFDLITVSLLFWSNYISPIRDLKIFKNSIYIWDQDSQIHVLKLLTVEKLILQTLLNKQYFLCGEICVHYINDILQLISSSNKIHFISILSDKLMNLNGECLVKKLHPILKAIENYRHEKQFGQKLNTGIVVVDNVHYLENKGLETFNEIELAATDKLIERTKFLELKNFTINETVIQEQAIKNGESTTEKPLDSDVLNVLYKQYEVNKLHPSIEIQALNDIFIDKDVDYIFQTFLDFLNLVNEKNTEDKMTATNWSQRQYLKCIQNNPNSKENLEAERFMIDSFKSINSSRENCCSCSFPLPSAKNAVPQYYNVGCNILTKHWTKNDTVSEICEEVPYMWRCVLENLRIDDDVNSLLALLVQYNEESLFSTFLCKFTYDIWDYGIKLLISLKNKKCLNCEKTFESKDSDIISWTSFGLLIVQSIGGLSAVNLLLRYSSDISPSELNQNFYKTCIFTTSFNDEELKNSAVNFTRAIFTNKATQQKFDNKLSKYMHNKYVGQFVVNVSNRNILNLDSKCSFCNLPFHCGVLDDEVVLCCGFNFHNICFQHNERVCTNCKK